ncbi:hypothetical protein [Mannheimia granulomatis]|nr:hypothetical protein [Mannheimia granulomatis]
MITMLFYASMMLYVLAFCAVCRQCHQLKARYTLMLSIIMLVVGVLLYQWLSHHKILVSLTDATLVVMLLEWGTVGLGVVYQFGYLRTKIGTDTQREMLWNCPTYALIIPFLLNTSVKKQYHTFWQKYHQHNNDVSFPY